MIKEVKKLIKGRKLKSFSLGELLIALGIIGVLVMILMPILSKAKPDENEVLHKKATFIVERVVNELATDEFLYPKSSEYSGLSNTSPVVINGETHLGTTKFCTLFASRINKAPNTTINCANGQKSVTSVEGIDWYLPISGFKNNDYETIKVDVNGSKGPNCMVKSKTCYHPDQFEYKIKRGTKLSVKNIENMDATAPPAARPIMPDEPAGNTTDPRTGQNWYCIRCNPTTNGSVYGYGCNKPNGHYQLVAIPKIGYKGSWFTKSVTVNNADVPASECNVTFSPIVDIPTPDQGIITPPPTPTPDPTPEKTYCINVTKTGGDVTQCAVAGDGCNKKPGTYIVSASGKGDYKTSWSTKNVTIENKDVNLTLVCDKDPEPDPCYSITTTGDTTNCPVTLPAGTCETDKNKYTAGTYSYTVTPKAGYTFNKVTEASTKQIIINDKDESIPIECAAAAAEETKVHVNWLGPGLIDVSLKVTFKPIQGNGETKVISMKGDGVGDTVQLISPGKYAVVALANGRVAKNQPLLNLGVTVSPNSIEIPKGTTGNVFVSLSDYNQDPIDKTGSLQIRFYTNGIAVTDYSINLGNKRYTGSGRWGDARTTLLSDIPVGLYAVNLNSCRGDFGGGLLSVGSGSVSPGSVTIQDGKTSNIELTCTENAQPAQPINVCVIPIFGSPVLPSDYNPIPSKLKWGVNLFGPKNYLSGINETSFLGANVKELCYDNVTPGTYTVSGGVSHYYVTNKSTGTGNWWASNGTGNIPSPSSITVPNTPGNHVFRVQFSSDNFIHDGL